MQNSKRVFKFICMTLVFSIVTAFTFTSYASANSQPEMSELQVEAQKALNVLNRIKDMDIKNVKETTDEKEFTLVLDDEESQLFYDKQSGELYVDGQLAVTDIVFEEGKAEKEAASEIGIMAGKIYNIGSAKHLEGYWKQTGYKSGSFNVVTVTVAAVVGLISLILTKSPTAASLNAAAGAVISALIVIDQYKVFWDMYSYKDSKKKFYHDSLSLFNYKGRKLANRICQINHYWGVI
ncbi:hypothetical protein HRF87_27435 [Bacillus sp. CRN 9]|nr:hypothetical protein [Bacillus sp. CRN 9]